MRWKGWLGEDAASEWRLWRATHCGLPFRGCLVRGIQSTSAQLAPRASGCVRLEKHSRLVSRSGKAVCGDILRHEGTANAAELDYGTQVVERDSVAMTDV